LGFLGHLQFRGENLRLRLFDFFGFPWILSSESGLFNGLRGISARKILASFLPEHREAQGWGAPVKAMRKRGIVHEPSLTRFLILRKKLLR
jgi:hypothetical protein